MLMALSGSVAKVMRVERQLASWETACEDLLHRLPHWPHLEVLSLNPFLPSFPPPQPAFPQAVPESAGRSLLKRPPASIALLHAFDGCTRVFCALALDGVPW